MKIVAPNNVPPTQGLAGPPPTQPENKIKNPTTDAVGKKTLQDPLRRLRDHVIETSAHATHPTAQGVAEGLKFDKKLGGVAAVVSTIAAAAPQVRAAYAQDAKDGHKWGGGHVANVAAHVGIGAGGGFVGDMIGAEVGEVAGAFVGGAFGGIGALPGAMIGGVIGGTIGGYIGSKMALDDLDSIQSAVSKRHA